MIVQVCKRPRITLTWYSRERGLLVRVLEHHVDLALQAMRLAAEVFQRVQSLRKNGVTLAVAGYALRM